MEAGGDAIETSFGAEEVVMDIGEIRIGEVVPAVPHQRLHTSRGETYVLVSP